MKATGVVRRIDDLGRIIIPREVRKELMIENGDPFEIFTDSEAGVVTFKKYSPISTIASYIGIKDFMKSYNRSYSKLIFTDNITILEAQSLSDYQISRCAVQDVMLTTEFQQLIKENDTYRFTEHKEMEIVRCVHLPIQMVLPINVTLDGKQKVYGSIIAVGEAENLIGPDVSALLFMRDVLMSMCARHKEL